MEMSSKTKTSEIFNTSLLKHIQEGNNGVVLAILQDANLSRPPSQWYNSAGETLLHVAARYGSARLARYLIERGANIDAQNHLKETPLMLAVNFYQREVATLLLEANADIFIPNQAGNCALKKAWDNEEQVYKNYPSNFARHRICRDILEALNRRVTSESLSKSRHVDSKVFHVSLPLYYFMQLKNVDVIRVLLEKGSPVDARDPETGETSLHMAVKNMDLKIAKLLLEYGADVNMSNVDGDTPITHIFSEYRDQRKALAMSKIFLAAAANLIDVHSRKIFVKPLLLNGNKKIIQSVLKCQLDLHFKDHEGYTAIHYLAKNQNPDVLVELRDSCFNVDDRTTNEQWTLLHCAASCGNASSILFLTDRGADINATCANGYTSLGLLCTQHYKDTNRMDKYIRCVEILSARGADPRILTETNHKDGRLVFNTMLPEDRIKMMHPVIAHLAAVDASGQDIGIRMLEMLEFQWYRKIFYSKEHEVEEMKRIDLGKLITMLDLLVASEKNISLYAKNRTLTSSSFNEVKIEDSWDPCYQRKLHESFLKLTKCIELRKRAAAAIDKIFIEVYNISVVNAAEKIIEHLEDHELYQLL